MAYADPPYPGCARRYYASAEVDHADLLAQLVGDFPDGWGLSTSADAVPMVFALAQQLDIVPRLNVWVRGARPSRCYRPRHAWEALFTFGGRLVDRAPDEACDDALVLPISARPRSHPGALVGMKPAGFARWLFELLGLASGDELVDLYPGSGAVSRAWALYSSRPAERHVAQGLHDTSRAHGRDVSCRARRDTSRPPADDRSTVAARGATVRGTE